MMFRADYTEEADRSEPEAVAGPSVERKLDLLVAVSPCAVAYLLETATKLLKKLQKQDPNFVRFTVDRMGTMAHVKFLKPLPGENS